MGDLSKHFSQSEFRCHDGSDHPIDPRLIDMLEQVRTHFGAPISITSGYRSKSYNKKIGGASSSYHCRGMAADFKVHGVDAHAVYDWCAHAFPLAGVGRYPTWVHLDCRGAKVRWG